MIILIGGEKGGTGKSCIAQNISVALLELYKDLIIVDCDPQKTTSDWVHERSKLNKTVEQIQCIQLYGNILPQLEKLKKKFQVVVIDCGGQDTKALRSSLVCCTHALFPIRPKRRDLRTLSHLDELLQVSKINNPNMKYSIVINQAPALPSQSKRITDAIEICKDWNIPCLNTILFHRNIYDDSEESGLSVTESDRDSKASEEIRSLVLEFFNKK
ncbi:MAG: AAA family ATPase [Rickettsia sp.]|uniref:AAA family ATPase n=1 Tax=Rickettsia sp. TaxID=789 RepID=UPI0039793703